jgi:hypothetical protein
MIKALIYLPAISKSVQRVREFRRCPEYDNLLAYLGRPLALEEFNKIASRVISDLTRTELGVLPCVKLVDIPDIMPVATVEPVAPVEPVAGAGAFLAPAPVEPISENCHPPELVFPDGVVIETLETGEFCVADYRAGAALYLGAGSSEWQSDISLITPFESPGAATFAAQATLLPSADATQPSAKRTRKSK